MAFVAAVAFVMYQKVHLLLDDTLEVAAEGDERYLRGPQMHRQMHRTPFRFIELRNSHFLHENSRNNCIVLINWIMKNQTRAEDQKLKINLEWPKAPP